MKSLELIRDILTSEKYCSSYDWGVSKGQLKEINYYYKIFENNIIDKCGVFIFISSGISGGANLVSSLDVINLGAFPYTTYALYPAPINKDTNTIDKSKQSPIFHFHHNL